tara:strand:- start:33 stop:482 length:450 start_codon:yes stop_codon:yes gene_type:complete
MEIDEIADLFVEQYKAPASNFAMVRGFLSAAIGHAVVQLSDRAKVQDLLRGAADAFDRGETPRSRHTKPTPWTPTDGDTAIESLAAEKVAGTIEKMHLQRPDADPWILNSAAFQAAFIMLAWHDHKAVADNLRAKAEAVNEVPLNLHRH